jgi:hypothetical protein
VKAISSFAALLVLSSTSAFAQATPSELKAFVMPPPQGFAQQKTFNAIGDSGYFQVPYSASPGGGIEQKDYQFVRYNNVKVGKKLTIWADWFSAIDAPVYDPASGEFLDGCQHTHLSYGVWGRWEVKTMFGLSEGWVYLGGGSMSGMRDAANNCVHVVNNPLRRLDPRFGWGNERLEFDVNVTYSFYKDFAIGVQANTHGSGTCTVPAGQFKACLEPAWAEAFIL